jgi:hypothetical protein
MFLDILRLESRLKSDLVLMYGGGITSDTGGDFLYLRSQPRMYVYHLLFNSIANISLSNAVPRCLFSGEALLAFLNTAIDCKL